MFCLTKPIRKLFKLVAILCFVLYLVYIFSYHLCYHSSSLLTNMIYMNPTARNFDTLSSTNISHIVFGIASSSKTWGDRRFYVESWWQPNITRGFLFLDKTRREFFPWPPSSPPLRVLEDTSRYDEYNKHKAQQAIRMVHMIVETFRAENKGVRWYVMIDDDTIIFVDNLVDVLAKYDHRKYFYIGANSESISSNVFNSFEMAFGGAGYALSYPLVEALVKNFEVCIKRYPTLYGSDHVVQSCVADLGVSLTQEKGFHQIDLHHDISGFLSAHPQSPLLSLHHLDAFHPLFPSMDRIRSLTHLMKAAAADSSRLLQQTICFDNQQNFTLSLSWGYSAHIYAGIHPPSILQIPIEMFWPWSRAARPPYMFNTRVPPRRPDPCWGPRGVFFLDSADEFVEGDYVVTWYNRTGTRRLPTCSSSGNGYVNDVDRIRVLSPLRRYNQVSNEQILQLILSEKKFNIAVISDDYQHLIWSTI